MLNIGKGNQLV